VTVLRITFLGTAASRPTVGRNVSAIAVQRGADAMLFDCGEGTQRQMMRYGSGFAVADIFVTHLHADHFLGVIGLIRTMGLQGRTEVLRLWGPPGSRALLTQAVHLGIDRVPFEVIVDELEAGCVLKRDGYDILPYRSRHGVNSLGFALVEAARLGRFHPERARALGVPEGPLFGRLHRGEAVQVDGRVISAAEVVGEPRPGRRVVYSGDTRPCRATIDAARGADLLIHDATFAQDEADRAKTTGHSTAREAAEIAASAGVERLVLTHLSARYAEDPKPLEREARDVFENTQVAWDGMTIEVPLRDEEEVTR
jgi:ribonuclease Z